MRAERVRVGLGGRTQSRNDRTPTPADVRPSTSTDRAKGRAAAPSACIRHHRPDPRGTYGWLIRHAERDGQDKHDRKHRATEHDRHPGNPTPHHPDQ